MDSPITNSALKIKSVSDSDTRTTVSHNLYSARFRPGKQQPPPSKRSAENQKNGWRATTPDLTRRNQRPLAQKTSAWNASLRLTTRGDRLRHHCRTIIRRLPRRCSLQLQQPHSLPHYRRQLLSLDSQCENRKKNSRYRMPSKFPEMHRPATPNLRIPVPTPEAPGK